ncbi:SdpA family antimicrobial peptide system protein [Streptomyces sp. XM4193]|uniref:SdpA family antimicrobial peptide system protein n=1 Tax=Streptomyces sp. XM4193 TaxID=2929782 RepID=UPI001FF8157B|nr:SdpA family antimicrobial peptide system protein [Streptomyces sp. XM4193]MCK1794824.1 SdpA family antimicrobial peptide system protein [Streptomyces sp. XM4193]
MSEDATPERVPEVTAAARRTFTYGGAVCGTLVLALTMLHLPSTAVVSTDTRMKADPVRHLTAQGWSFFTRTPREHENAVFGHRDGSWERLSYRPYTRADTWFGLDRSTRTEDYEIGALNKAADGDWRECREAEPADCLEQQEPRPEPGARARISAENPRFCGTVALTRQEPVPWAWASDVSAIPAEYQILDVSCEKIARSDKKE